MIRGINKFTDIQLTSFSKIDINEILNTHSFSLSKISNLFGRGGIDQNAFCVPCSPHEDCYDQTIPSNFSHDTKFTSLAFKFDKPFDIDLLKVFLDDSLSMSSSQIRNNTSHEYAQENNHDNVASIYRMKGMIKIKGQENLYILQSVYDIFDIQPTDYVGESSSIILIGFHLKEKELNSGFCSCLDDSTKCTSSI